MEKIFELFKKTLDHSIAQTLLIFSGVLVIILIGRDTKAYYISFSLFTLIYTMANFKIEAIRKSETLGRFTTGDKTGVILYSCASIFLLLWWATGTWLWLSGSDWLAKLFSWQNIPFYPFLLSVIFLGFWFFRGLIKLPKTKEPIKSLTTENTEIELSAKIDDVAFSIKKSKRSDSHASNLP